MTEQGLTERVAVVETQMRQVALDLAEIKSDLRAGNADIRAMRDAMMQVRGGWKTAIAIGGAGGAIGALLAKVLPLWWASK